MAEKEKPTDKLGEGLNEALSGLAGVLGGLGKTVGGVTKGVTGLVGGLLGELLGPLRQLKQDAEAGDEQAARAYGQAVSKLQKSAAKGRKDAKQILAELGEALDEEPEDEGKKPH